jgi:diacylglycerol kinase family enzyme
VAQAALAADLPFGAIALGTFNYFARAQSLPLDAAEAARAALLPGLRPVQVGLVNGRVFLVNASLGLYPQLLADREHFKARYGRRRLVAFAAALGTILRAGRRLSLVVETPRETRTILTAALVVDNNRLQLEQLGLPEAGAVEQGRLVAMFVKPAAPSALLRLLARALLHRLDGTREVERLAVRGLRVTLRGGPGRATLPVAVDGEPLRMSLPLEFSVAPRPLRLIAPQ